MDIYLNTVGKTPLAFVETITISRSVNRQNAYAVGSPIRVDSPVTQATVNVQASCLVPIASNGILQAKGANVVVNSLLNEVSAEAVDIIITQKGNSSIVLAHVTNAFYNDDATTVPNTALLAYNLSWTADDTLIFVANN